LLTVDYLYQASGMSNATNDDEMTMRLAIEKDDRRP
jgi:hypothetical protein